MLSSFIFVSVKENHLDKKQPGGGGERFVLSHNSSLQSIIVEMARQKQYEAASYITFASMVMSGGGGRGEVGSEDAHAQATFSMLIQFRIQIQGMLSPVLGKSSTSITSSKTTPHTYPQPNILPLAELTLPITLCLSHMPSVKFCSHLRFSSLL